LSWGWTVIFKELNDPDVYFPLCILIGLMNVVFTGLNRLDDDSHFRYHEYDGWISFAIILVRISYFVYFKFMVEETFD
jgi:hypothetical protein